MTTNQVTFQLEANSTGQLTHINESESNPLTLEQKRSPALPVTSLVPTAVLDFSRVW